MQKLIGNYAFNPEYENVVPTDDTKLMKCDFVNWVGHIQMDPNSRLDTCKNKNTAPFEVVTGVVPATTSPMPKSKQENGFVK